MRLGTTGKKETPTLSGRQWGVIEGFGAGKRPELSFGTGCLERRKDFSVFSLTGSPGLLPSSVAGAGSMWVASHCVCGCCQSELSSVVTPFSLLDFPAQDFILAKERSMEEQQKDTEMSENPSSAGPQVSQTFF